MTNPTLQQKTARNWHEILKAYLQRLRAERTPTGNPSKKTRSLEAEIFY